MCGRSQSSVFVDRTNGVRLEGRVTQTCRPFITNDEFPSEVDTPTTVLKDDESENHK